MLLNKRKSKKRGVGGCTSFSSVLALMTVILVALPTSMIVYSDDGGSPAEIPRDEIAASFAPLSEPAERAGVSPQDGEPGADAAEQTGIPEADETDKISEDSGDAVSELSEQAGDPGTKPGVTDPEPAEAAGESQTKTGIHPLSAQENGVYTVGAGMDYATPADAIADTGNLRAGSSAPWVMELREDFTISAALIIPANAEITIRSGAGTQHKLDANGQSRVIEMNSPGAKLTLENVTITGGKDDGVSVNGGFLTMNGGKITHNAGRAVSLTNGSVFTMRGASSEISHHVIAGYTVAVHNSVFNMYDGKIANNDNFYGAVCVFRDGDKLPSDSVFNMYGGVVGGDSPAEANTGRYPGVLLSTMLWGSPGGTFNMYGGRISYNDSRIGNNEGGGAPTGYAGLTVANGGVATIMGDAEISHNYALSHAAGIYIADADTVTLKGNARVTENYSEGSSGGIALTAGTLIIEENAAITNNTAVEVGGGVRLLGNAAGPTSVIMNGGTISGNKTTGASKDGGGVFAGANTSFTMNGGAIYGNTTTRNGGGAFITGVNAFFTINGGVVADNTAANFGGGLYITGASASLTIKSGVISGNTAASYGGGVFSPSYNNLTIPADGSVAFRGNTALRLYKLKDEHKTAPPISFAGAVSEISVANLNEINGFDVSTPDNIAAANKKSVFNNYDINYTSAEILDVCAVKYLDENDQPIKGLSSPIAVERGTKTKYLLAATPAGETGNFNWMLSDASNAEVFRDGESEAIGTNTLLAPQSAAYLNVSQPGEPSSTVTASLTFSALPEYTISYNLNGGANAAGNPVSYTKRSAFPLEFGAPAKADHVFAGWTADYTSGNGTDVTTPAKDYRIPAGTTGNVTLTAQWTENAAPPGTDIDTGGGNTSGTGGTDGTDSSGGSQSSATGDASPLVGIAAIAIGSSLVILILLLWSWRKRKDADDPEATRR
jgi:uncharacterized repeat protein (TIGR02543 family)